MPQLPPVRTKLPKYNLEYRKDKLSMVGVLQFCYNYNIIDRFVMRKDIAQILNQYRDPLDFDSFVEFLR